MAARQVREARAAARWPPDMGQGRVSVRSAPVPGRSCPLSYRYPATVFNRPAEVCTSTLYVVGGLYGNVEALHAIEALYAREATGCVMIFNGDFHWFDADPVQFTAINAAVYRHRALRGNVETELASDDSSAGCGCAYPAHVDDADVDRSNAILKRLRETARACEPVRQALGSLPMHAVARVGCARVGVVHGDAESLAGWRFDAAVLTRPDRQAWLQRVFEEAQVDVFASSHTCTPALHVLAAGEASAPRAVINNGAAGMSNYPGTRFGVITRISTEPAPSGVPVIHEVLVCGVRVQQVRVLFDDAAWQRRFLSVWPEGSDAYRSYWQRIVSGPAGGQACAPI